MTVARHTRNGGSLKWWVVEYAKKHATLRMYLLKS
jgi:hypothetical protein